jgi:hypothetical protein
MIGAAVMQNSPLWLVIPVGVVGVPTLIWLLVARRRLSERDKSRSSGGGTGCCPSVR